MGSVITGYIYFVLKYMFHARYFFTFHNSEQKHNFRIRLRPFFLQQYVSLDIKVT